MRVAIGADHAGFELKQALVQHLSGLDHELHDIGAHEYLGDDDYPDYACSVARLVCTGTADRGIVVCGSGVGSSVAANKLRDVRASVCHDTYSARQSVEHDDLNVLCLGGRIVGLSLAVELVDAFLGATYRAEERYERRLRKVRSLENPA